MRGALQSITTALVLAALTAAVPAAALEVNGTLSGEHRWTPADSPVRVTGDLLVPAGGSLEVEPGVRVEFAGPFRLTVNGLLRAVGEAGSLVVFTAEQPMVDSLRWRGLRFVNADRDCRLTFCRIEYGWARGDWPDSYGGGIYMEGSSPLISRCEISRNRADSDGGGIYGWFTTSVIRNNLVAMNYSGRFGGGMYMDYSSPQVVNNTVAFDTALAWGGGIYVGSNGTPQIMNCILTFNIQKDTLDGRRIFSDNNYFQDLAKAHGSAPEVSFSCIREDPTLDPYPGSGNIAANPMFLNVQEEPFDFHLGYSSPCIDSGDPQTSAVNEPDQLVNRVNMGVYGGTEEGTLSVPVIYNQLYELGVAIDYDSIRINSQRAHEIRVENRGHYRLFIREFQFNHDVFYPDSAENDAGVLVPSYAVAPIEPGEQERFNINFRPTDLVTYHDTLRIISSDSISPVPEIVLNGTGINPIGSLPDSINFGARQIDSTHTDTLWV